MMPHEQGLALFIAPNRRARFRHLLDSPNRTKLTSQLAHLAWLDDRFSTPVRPNQLEPATLPQWLAHIHAPSRCYVVSETDALDGKEFASEEAVRGCLTDDRGFASFISFLPGSLALYLDEDAARILLLRRPL